MTLAWLRKKEQQSDPLTPWQQYQARQQQTPRHDRRQKPKLDVNLPKIQTLRRRKLVKNLVLILLPLLLLLGVFGQSRTCECSRRDNGSGSAGHQRD